MPVFVVSQLVHGPDLGRERAESSYLNVRTAQKLYALGANPGPGIGCPSPALSRGMLTRSGNRRKSTVDGKNIMKTHPGNRSIKDFPELPILVLVKKQDRPSLYSYHGIFKNTRVVTDPDGAKWFDLIRR